ncbi:phosphoesterase [Planctomycetota bacterium]|nr:phosphoesterase [Planctomycetota bacterium]
MKRTNPPLRLHVLSDLHIEHGGFIAPMVACDVVVVAGDLANGRRMTKALMDLCNQVRKPVVYVPGNHDWYQVDIAGERSSMVRAWRVGAGNLQVLDDGVWRYEHHGVTYRFIGSTWWSSMDWTEDGSTGEDAFARVRAAALGCLNDYRLIRKDDRPLTPDDSRAMHALSTRFLQQQIAEAQAVGEVPIVVTHFLPSRSSCHEQYRGSLVNAYFANDRDDLTTGVPLWIHGHTHRSFDYTLPTGCRVVCNPRGYGTENLAFQLDLRIEVAPIPHTNK